MGEGSASAAGAASRPDSSARATGEALTPRLANWLEAMFEGVVDAVSVQNTDGALIYANQAAARACGYETVDEFLAAGTDGLRERFEFLDEGGKPPAAGLPNRQVLGGGPAHASYARLRDRATGTERWILFRSTPVRGADGAIEVVVNSWHDITERHKRDEAARVLGRMMAAVQELHDPDETLAAVAKAIVPFVADWCTVDLFEDNKFRPVAVAHQDPAKVTLALDVQRRYPPEFDPKRGLGRIVTTGEAELHPRIPLEALRASARSPEHGRILEELGLRSAIAVPLRSRGKVFGTITFILAESGRVYDEIDFELAQELGLRAGIAVENARLYQEAQAAARIRDAFLAVAGHELRTPITALGLQLQSLAGALENGTFAANFDRWKERVNKTVKHVGRLDRLVNELLDVSRISSGRHVLDREEVDLAALAAEVVERHADESARRLSPLIVTHSGDTRGHWDRSRLDQIVTNLVENALKYGEGKPIELNVVGEPDAVRLSIHDRGIGIELSAHARIFGRFERAVSERHYAGFGLGLWIVRELVEAHGGVVSFESAPRVGSTFTVALPRVAPEGA
jgi:signal transduction histidine kinase